MPNCKTTNPLRISAALPSFNLTLFNTNTGRNDDKYLETCQNRMTNDEWKQNTDMDES